MKVCARCREEKPAEDPWQRNAYAIRVDLEDALMYGHLTPGTELHAEAVALHERRTAERKAWLRSWPGRWSRFRWWSQERRHRVLHAVALRLDPACVGRDLD